MMISRYVVGLLLGGLVALQCVQAGPILVAVNRGGIDQDGKHANAGSGFDGNANFLAGTCFLCPPSEVRNFFVFDLTGVAGPITSATLELQMRVNGFQSPEGSENYKLFDYTQAVSTLGPGTPGLAAFNDLGSGTSYGEVTLTSADNGTIVNIALNSSAIAAINAALGTKFALGGAITTLTHGAGVSEFAWGNSLDTATSKLELNPDSIAPTPNPGRSPDPNPVPEPSTMLLGSAGLALLGFLRHRRPR